MLKIICFACISLFLLVNNLVGQQYGIVSYGANDGLDHPYAQSVVQNPKGYTWVGTSEGLFRFDGIYFDVFTYVANDSLSLSDNNVKSLLMDEEHGALWVGTYFGGICRMDVKTYKFDRIQRNRTKNHVNEIGIVRSLLRYNNYLFIGTEDTGLQVYDIKTEEFTDLVLFDKGSSYSVYDVKQINNTLEIATSIGLYRYDLSQLLKENYQLQVSDFNIGKDQINSITQSSDSTIELCTKNRLVSISMDTKQATVLYRTLDQKTLLVCHLVDGKGNVWLGTNGDGLLQLSMEGKVVNKLLTNNNGYSLASNWVSTLTYSEDHNLLWIGTKGGLSKLSDDDIRFKHVQTSIDGGIGGDDIFFLHKDLNRNYWWWSYKGFFFKKENESPQVFKSREGFDLKNDTITCSYETSDGMLWLGSFNGLFSVDIHDHSVQRYQFDCDLLTNHRYNTVTDVLPLNTDLWLITYSGIIKFDLSSGSYELFQFPSDFGDKGIIVTSTGNFDDQGMLWIGSKGGHIISFNKDELAFNMYSSANISAHGDKMNNSVFGLLPMSDSTLWLSTFGSGLLSFNTNSKVITPLHYNDQLSTNIYSIYPDENGYCWVNTNSKVLRIDPKNKKVLSFGKIDGTFCREFNERSHYQAADGAILMGGFGGFIEFDPNDFKINAKIPQVSINSYFINDDHDLESGQVFYNLSFLESDTLEISTADNKVTFNGSVFNYQNANRNMIAWKLEGYDAKWDTLMSYSAKSYSFLDEGEYTLRVKGGNNDNIWNDDGASIHLIVKPTFFDSRLFRYLLGALGIVVIYLVYLVRIRYLSQHRKNLEIKVQQRTIELQQANSELEDSKEEVIVQKSELERHRYYLEELVQERTVDLQEAKEKAENADRLKTAFLANLSHEIRTPMNAIVGFSSLLSSDVYDKEERKEFANAVQKSSDSLLVLINDIIDISRIETGQIQLVSKCFNIYDLCTDVYRSLKLGHTNKLVKFELNLPEELKSISLVSDPERLKQIIINLLNNALKFTSEGHVKLAVSFENRNSILKSEKLSSTDNGEGDVILFQVIDTGIGIEEEYYEHIFSPFQKVQEKNAVNDGIGLGLSIVKQLVEMLKGQIWLRSQPNVGTTFKFYIPYQTEKRSETKASDQQ
ncbi:hybrid sensor histidine kinase/response regulator [Carboxylicivirga sp. M1479]|uniref:sensor histidine kinase n=1 Tax=Carboxylicivirga sp. M1479 TaxID=2594476 RepID=UPI001178BFC4|nr:hybrid sensor histidine kinase/response regulator [Carboxylicivirga sp. M1479]TRX65997.1 hypothetical protein FNN09_16025 [Carboxylicivirga sp. M1479]